MQSIILDPILDFDNLVEKLAQWLRRCVRDHPLCRKATVEHYPRRLIKIGKSTSDLRLINIKDEKEPVYACLSFCWGRGPLPKLLLDNLDVYMQRIDYSSLPKTFQEAVVLTKRLGIDYLWINSLCIVQDSSGEREFELTEMPRVFQNAHLTIAASFGDDTSTGLYKIRESPPQHAGYYPLSPLKRQIWMFQEEYLSTRVLYCEDKEIRWICNTERRCECRGPLYEPKQDPTYEEWYRLVEFYSVRTPGLSIDWPLAISYLALMFAEKLNDEYVAGLWKNDLLSGLLWWRPGPAQTPDTYIAPSWSWASALNKIDYYGRCRHTYAKLLSTTCQPLSGNPYDRILDGTVVLDG
ncbi:heterokaryon incompatibility protein-domain-containing protein, partial [Macrophomina phaseolina]